MYKYARDMSWKFLIDCNVASLPVDVAGVCVKRGYILRNYKEGEQIIEIFGLSNQKSLSDGFTVRHKGQYYIFYNEQCSPGRQRFTIAHELGHIVLGHLDDGQYTEINREPAPGNAPEETQANQFAARLLAPACVLHALNVRSAEEVSQICGISHRAAEFRLARLRVLDQRGKYYTSPLEQKVYEQFRPFLEAHYRQ